MPWFRVDDNLAFHHKVVAAGNAAMGLWVRAGSMCSAQLTDGFVPDHMVAALGGKAQAQRLVAVGLWCREDGGYRFHEWAERQPSAADVKAAAEKQGVSGSLGNHRRWHLRKGVINPECEFCQAGDTSRSGRKADRVPDASPDTPPESGPNPPSRPVPSQPKEEVVGKSPNAARKRPAKPLPDDWQPTDDHRTRAADQGIDLERAAAKFRAHAEANDRRQANWNAAFTQWLLNEKPGPRPTLVREHRHVSEIEQPPDGLTDEEYAAWWRDRRRA